MSPPLEKSKHAPHVPAMKRYRNDDEVFTCLRNNATDVMQLQKLENVAT